MYNKVMEALRDLSELATLDPERVPIEDIAFLVAREKYPDLDLAHYQERLDEFARRASLRIGKVIGGRQIIEGLNRYLFEEEGFCGNKGDYYNPSNSYFNDVLDQRQGIPITLSILYVAIGRRLNLPVSGVAFPGHFMVRYEGGDASPLFIDPFYKGKILSAQDCEQRLKDMYGDSLPFRPEFLYASSHREILLRTLLNLKIIYMTRKDFEMALRMLNRILLFKPEGVEEVKERGILYYNMECFQPALRDLQSYLQKIPSASDRPVIEEYITSLKEKVELIQ